MGVDPTDFRDHANQLEEDHSNEISKRCSISRKYYAIFHLLREQNPSEFNMGAGDHGNAQDFIDDLGHRGLADDLETLHTKRKKADYDIGEEIDDMELAIFNNEFSDFLEEARRHNFISL